MGPNRQPATPSAGFVEGKRGRIGAKAHQVEGKSDPHEHNADQEPAHELGPTQVDGDESRRLEQGRAEDRSDRRRPNDGAQGLPLRSLGNISAAVYLARWPDALPRPRSAMPISSRGRESPVTPRIPRTLPITATA